SSAVMSPSVEAMRAEDLDAVLTIERASFSMPWSRGAFLYEIQQNRVARCWVMRDEGEGAGYLCLWEVADEVHITNLGVRPHRRPAPRPCAHAPRRHPRRSPAAASPAGRPRGPAQQHRGPHALRVLRVPRRRTPARRLLRPPPRCAR